MNDPTHRMYSDKEIATLWEHAASRASTSKHHFSDSWWIVFLIVLPLLSHDFSPSILTIAVILSSVFLLFYGLTLLVIRKAKKNRQNSKLQWAPIAMVLLIFYRGITIFFFSNIFYLSTTGNIQLFGPSIGNILSETVVSSVYALFLIFAFALEHLYFKTYVTLDPYEIPGQNSNHLLLRFTLWVFIISILATTILSLIYKTINNNDVFQVIFLNLSILFIPIAVPEIYFALRLAFLGIDTSPYSGALNARLKEASKVLRVRHKDSSSPTDYPMWCEGCSKQTYINVDDMDQSYFTVCSNCGTENAQIWCEDSGMGGQFIENIEDHPMSFKCLGCGNTHDLPDDFYKHTVTMLLNNTEK